MELSGRYEKLKAKILGELNNGTTYAELSQKYASHDLLYGGVHKMLFQKSLEMMVYWVRAPTVNMAAKSELHSELATLDRAWSAWCSICGEGFCSEEKFSKIEFSVTIYKLETIRWSISRIRDPLPLDETEWDFVKFQKNLIDKVLRHLYLNHGQEFVVNQVQDEVELEKDNIRQACSAQLSDVVLDTESYLAHIARAFASFADVVYRKPTAALALSFHGNVYRRVVAIYVAALSSAAQEARVKDHASVKVNFASVLADAAQLRLEEAIAAAVSNAGGVEDVAKALAAAAF